MKWNFRLLAHEYKSFDEVCIKIHEVYYDEHGKPNSYSDYHYLFEVDVKKDIQDPNQAYINEIIENLEYVKLACSQPILWHGDRFPEEYKPNKK